MGAVGIPEAGESPEVRQDPKKQGFLKEPVNLDCYG